MEIIVSITLPENCMYLFFFLFVPNAHLKAIKMTFFLFKEKKRNANFLFLLLLLFHD